MFATPNASATALATTARTTEIDSDNASDAATFWPTSVSSRRDTRNVPVWIERAEAAAERPEDVAPHADGGRNEHEQTGQRLQGAGDGTERQAGDEVP